jgi:hypothetical protein
LNAMQDVGGAQKLKQIRYVDMGAQCDNVSMTFDGGLRSSIWRGRKCFGLAIPRANEVRLLATGEGNESVAVRHRHLR